MSDQRPLGWVISVQASNDPKPKLYAVVVEPKAYLSVADELARAQALVGEHLSVTKERVEFQRRLTDGEVARLGLKAGEVKRFE
jgi:hypothetical protein